MIRQESRIAKHFDSPLTGVHGAPPRAAPAGLRMFALALMAAVFMVPVGAQQRALEQTITPNFKDADLAAVIDAVATATGKTFIVDPRVKAQVTMLSSTPMGPNAFYEAFLSILQVHGYVAVPSGTTVKIIPDANARQVPGNDLPNSVNAGSDELVTQVVAVRNVSAAQLVPILRPLIATYGNLVAYAQSNMLIITDRSANVARMLKIIERIDRAGDDDIEVVQLQNATSADIVKTVNALSAGTPAQGAEAGAALRVIADDRTNSVLLSGDKSQRLRIRTLITYLDTPLQSGGNTQVRYLSYSDAEDIAKKLKEQIQGITQATTASAAPAGGAPPAAAASNVNNSVSIWADKPTNALIVSAPPKVMQQIMAIVDKLDIRRAQVHVEAILVEVSASKSAELGVNWAVYGSGDSETPIALFNAGTNSISNIASAVVDEDYSSLPTGMTLGVGRILNSGTSFAAILQALQQDGNTNVISTPSILTMDNQEAKIEIAQEVPFITGQYANTTTTTGGSGSNTVNPFQTVQRENVGTILKITPQINNQGESVLLAIEQEASSLGSKGDAVDLITNKRTISTKVMVEDGGIIVLGGLLDDNLTEGQSRVPVLGSIPIIGNLFKTRNSSKSKTNLMLFIRPTILRDGVQAAFETNAKYNFMRNQQLQRNNGKVTLQPGENQPTLPDISTYMRSGGEVSPAAPAEQPANESSSGK